MSFELKRPLKTEIDKENFFMYSLITVPIVLDQCHYVKLLQLMWRVNKAKAVVEYLAHDWKIEGSIPIQ
jgi:hypothetical protein